jgi:YHS domain-containing protein
MSPVISFLVFAALFYFIMRFGCGAHMVHGHHHREGQGAGHAGSARDPVCGMDVEAGRGYSEIFEGKEYRFCSRNCLDKFDAEPQRYVQAGRASA